MFYIWHRGHTQLFWDIKQNQPERQRMVDSLFVAVFGELTSGSFVEIGCYDGINAGVITPLADLGWKGLCVDANPGQAQACRKNHKQNPNVETVAMAVGAFEGKVKLYGGGAGATVNEDYKKAAKNIGWAGHLKDAGEVPQTTLNKLLEGHNFEPGFELLSVDVEGNEPDVFEAFDLEHWKPMMMVIEMTDGHPDFKTFHDLNQRYIVLREKILASGYSEIHRDEINTVYVRSDLQHTFQEHS